jgi:hypothetical protein
LACRSFLLTFVGSVTFFSAIAFLSALDQGAGLALLATTRLVTRRRRSRRAHMRVLALDGTPRHIEVAKFFGVLCLSLQRSRIDLLHPHG